MYTILLLSESPISLATFAARAESRIRGAQVNVVSDEHVEVLRGDDYTTIQATEDDPDMDDTPDRKKYRIEHSRVQAWVLAFPRRDLIREVLDVLAEQVSVGWIEDDNAIITPLSAYRERLARA